MTREKTICHTGPCGVQERECCCFLCPDYNQCPHELKCTSIDLFIMPRGCPNNAIVLYDDTCTSVKGE